MALDTVQDYIDHARVLLQDTVTTYRYPDADFIMEINAGILEMRAKRPDMFIGLFDDIPSYTLVTDEVFVDPQYRMSLLYYVVGMIQLRDEEPTSDSRAGSFIAKFNNQLTNVAS